MHAGGLVVVMALPALSEDPPTKEQAVAAWPDWFAQLPHGVRPAGPEDMQGAQQPWLQRHADDGGASEGA